MARSRCISSLRISSTFVVMYSVVSFPYLIYVGSAGFTTTTSNPVDSVCGVFDFEVVDTFRVIGIELFFGLYSCKHKDITFWSYLLYEMLKTFCDEIMSRFPQFRSGILRSLPLFLRSLRYTPAYLDGDEVMVDDGKAESESEGFLVFRQTHSLALYKNDSQLMSTLSFVNVGYSHYLMCLSGWSVLCLVGDGCTFQQVHYSGCRVSTRGVSAGFE